MQIGCEAQAIQCDVTDQEQQKEVFTKHMEQFGLLDIAILNAGVGEGGDSSCCRCKLCFKSDHDSSIL